MRRRGPIAVALAALCAAVLQMPPPVRAKGKAPAVLFRNVTREAGITFRHNTGATGRMYMPEGMGSGCGFLDADGDGWLDILLVNGRNWAESGSAEPTTMVLYRNLGDGRFQDVTERAGLAVQTYGMGCAAGDYDNDGDLDIYITSLGPNLLFRNEGGGRFSDVTAQAGVGDTSWTVCAAWLDYDRDGDLDLFSGNYLRWTRERDRWLAEDVGLRPYSPQLYEPANPHLYRNEGGVFTDVSAEAGILDPPGKGMSAVAFDYDADGWPDILMSNDTLRDYLYRNRGDGTFSEEGILAGVALSAEGVAKSGMGVDIGDTRNSGLPDIAIGSFTYQMVSFFRNQGQGYFSDESQSSGVGPPSASSVTFAVHFLDYDLDGWLDLFAAAGHVESDIEEFRPHQHYAQRPLLFHNRGDGTFEETGKQRGDLRWPMVGRGAAVADYDNDGDPDILVNTNNGAPALLRNDGGNGNRSLRVVLEGTASNRSGIGARIRARTGRTTQTQWIYSGRSYCSHSDLAGLFGLGQQRAVDAVEVVWSSGKVDSLKAVSAGQTIRVREGEGIVARIPFTGSRPRRGK